MSSNIRWSPRAVSDVKKHLDHLQKEWNNKVAIKVLDRIETVLKVISENPDLYPGV